MHVGELLLILKNMNPNIPVVLYHEGQHVTPVVECLGANHPVVVIYPKEDY
jgi:hypothetical protein